MTLNDIEGDEQSDWLINTDSILSYEEVSLSNEDENDTTTTEGTYNYAELEMRIRNSSLKNRNTIIDYVYHWFPH